MYFHVFIYLLFLLSVNRSGSRVSAKCLNCKLYVVTELRSISPPWLKLYRALNIRIVLVGLEIWTASNYFDVDFDSETTLDRFLLWRQTDLLKRTKHDNAQFVT